MSGCDKYRAVHAHCAGERGHEGACFQGTTAIPSTFSGDPAALVASHAEMLAALVDVTLEIDCLCESNEVRDCLRCTVKTIIERARRAKVEK